MIISKYFLNPYSLAKKRKNFNFFSFFGSTMYFAKNTPPNLPATKPAFLRSQFELSFPKTPFPSLYHPFTHTFLILFLTFFTLSLIRIKSYESTKTKKAYPLRDALSFLTLFYEIFFSLESEIEKFIVTG